MCVFLYINGTQIYIYIYIYIYIFIMLKKTILDEEIAINHLKALIYIYIYIYIYMCVLDIKMFKNYFKLIKHCYMDCRN